MRQVRASPAVGGANTGRCWTLNSQSRAMAAELTQDSVLLFLQSHGGSVTNADLLLHFRYFLREHADRQKNRELFKKFVNTVARVKQEDGVSHVVLQRRFRGHGQGISSGGSKGESPSVSAQSNVHLSPLWNADKRRNKSPEPKAPQAGPMVLPAAGILLSNNNNNTIEPNLNLPQRKVQQSHAAGPAPQAVLTSVKGKCFEPPTAQPEPTLSREHTGPPDALSRREAKAAPEVVPEPREPKLFAERAPVPVFSGFSTPPQNLLQSSAPPLNAGRGARVSPRQAHNMPQQRQPSPVKLVPPHVSVSEAPFHSQQPRAPRTVARHRPSYRSALSLGDDDEEDDDDDDDEEAKVPVRRASVPLESAGMWGETTGAGERPERGTSQSSAALEASPSPVQLHQLQGLGASAPSEEPHGTGLRQTPPSQLPKVSPERTVPQIQIQDVDPGSRRGSDPQPRFRTGFPLPVHNLYGSSSSVERCPKMGQVSSGWSSYEDLTRTGGAQAGVHRAGRSWQGSADEESPGETRVRGWHRSTGDLYDDGADTSTSSAPSPPASLRPAVVRRQSSNFKRMCLSVGADLDQLMDEEDRRALGGSEAARLHRLHLISSSLSLRNVSSMSSLSSCSTPPRCHSLADLTDRDTPSEHRSTPGTPQHGAATSRQSQVPLEEKEHLWLVKAASGMWPDIYSLFREDPSLLHRRDFISGFTVLHWIAKHGDHRVLNTLWYGVEKAGLMLDIDAQSSCGYTPLHVATIHNHKNIIRLLVSKFKASVSLRDAAGRKAWFYLPPGAPPDLFQLLGAPAKAALGPTAVEQTWAAPQTHPQTQRRRRRHRFSSASGQRPLTFSGDAKVKRSSSLAAFLKHKSLQKIKAEWAI